MADDKKENSEKTVVVAKNAAELQKIRLEKLMKNPDKPVHIPDASKAYKPRDPLEFIRNVWGSSAGAGSGDFHVYRGVRRREYARQKFNKEKNEKEEKDEEYHEKVQQNAMEAEARTAKKRAKRLKKKQNQRNKKQKKEEKSEESEEEDESEEEQGGQEEEKTESNTKSKDNSDCKDCMSITDVQGEKGHNAESNTQGNSGGVDKLEQAVVVDTDKQGIAEDTEVVGKRHNDVVGGSSDSSEGSR